MTNFEAITKSPEELAEHLTSRCEIMACYDGCFTIDENDQKECRNEMYKAKLDWLNKEAKESEGRMKYECKTCGLECSAESSFEPTVCLKNGTICYGWHKVIAPTPKPLPSAILPKLTVEVFDREDCPKWANYAAVIVCVLIAGALTIFACAAAHYKRIVDASITQHEKKHIEHVEKAK